MKKTVFAAAVFFLLSGTAAHAAELSGWAEKEYISANSSGLMSYNIVLNNMRKNITRGEFCDLAVNLYTALTKEDLPMPEIFPFDDCVQPSVAKAYGLGIVNGVKDAEFMPDSDITREQMAKIFYAVLEKSGISVYLKRGDTDKYLSNFSDRDELSSWAEVPAAFLLKNEILNGVDKTTLAPRGYATREQAIALTNRLYEKFSDGGEKRYVPEISNIKNNDTVSGDLVLKWKGDSSASGYKVIIKDSSAEAVIVYTTGKKNVIIPSDKLQGGKQYSVVLQASFGDGTETFSLPVEFLTSSKSTPASRSPAPSGGDGLTKEQKEKRVFEGGEYFTSREQAEQYMTDITVNVWKINSNGEKYASTLPLTVNRNLADDITAVFDEIFSDPSRFPIKSAGCFQWRNTSSGRLSQHSYGTCIDINPNENYYVSAQGTALSGAYWKPGEDPYSVTEDGIVVKTFAKYGFLWGGNAWGDTSPKDYMHFTYLGN